MVFSSALFLFVFFPIVLLVYFILKNNFKNIWLLLVSLFFYSWGEPKYIILMLLSIGINYILALTIQKTGEKNKCAWLLILSVVINIGLLSYFKYFNFIILNINKIFRSDIFSVREIALPIGISFYTFQTLSYVIDVYRQKIPAQKNIINLGLYISFFPQLIAGPIVRYIDIEKQIERRTVTYDDFYYGCRRFMVGFSKKILIADQLSPFVDSVFLLNGASAGLAWLGALAYSLQIFFDFSGYSDMAIGIGRMFGFRFSENFNYPYISNSIQEFWRRWHISLSSWFRDYVYIPLGGSRCSSFRTCMNLVIVFFLTGLWHGASWNFVIWGLYYVFFLILERVFLGKYLKIIPKIITHIYSLLIIIIGWVFFRADGLIKAFSYIKNMVNFNGDLITPIVIYLNKQYLFCMIIGILFSVPVIPKLKEKAEKTEAIIILDIGILCLFVIAISYMLGKGFSPFLYFRF